MVFTGPLCRICAQLGDACYSILDATNERNIELKMYKCLSMTVNEDDSKPKEICNCCYTKLNDFYEFFEMCYTSDRKFEDSLLQKQSEDLKNCQFNGVIVNNEKAIENQITSPNVATLGYGTSNENFIVKTVEYETKPYSTVLRHSSDFYEIPEKPIKCIKNKGNIKAVSNCAKKRFVCQHCKKHFTRRNSLNVHLSLHSKTKPYSCDICLKAFANERHLKSHKILHTNKYRCEVCLKSFSVPSKYQRHLRTHSQQRLFVCLVEGCGKSFVDKSNLRGHELTHTDIKLFACNVCNKNYRTGSQLREHTKAHDNLVAFACNFCGKNYKWKSNLSAHMKKHDGRYVKENKIT